MTNKQNTNEDNVFTDKIKRAAQGAAAKYLPGGLGGNKAKAQKEIRERANTLMQVWKQQEAAGRKRTLRDLKAWLRQGDNPISPSVFKKALTSVNSKVDLSDVDNELSNGELRDILIGIARHEKRLSSTADIAQTSSQQAAKEREANTKQSAANKKRSTTNTKRTKQNAKQAQSSRERNQEMFQGAAGKLNDVQTLKKQIADLQTQVDDLKRRG